MLFAFNKIVLADNPSNINDIFQTCDDIVKMKGLTFSKYNNAIKNVEVLCLQLTNDKTFVSLLDFGMSSVIEAIEITKLNGKWNQEKSKKLIML